MRGSLRLGRESERIRPRLDPVLVLAELQVFEETFAAELGSFDVVSRLLAE
jgi:hypothetical protein